MPKLQEQVAHHTYAEQVIPRVKRASRPNPQNSVGTQAGLHPEDQPYTTEEKDPFDTRRPTTSRRWVPITEPITKVEQEPIQGMSFQRLLFVATCVLAIAVILAILLSTVVFPALQRWKESIDYGTPPISRTEANVGHGDIVNSDSRFIGINNGGIIEVIELSESTGAPHVYVIAKISGQYADSTPVSSITFVDSGKAGKPDMEVTVGSTAYYLYNTGSAFQQGKP